MKFKTVLFMPIAIVVMLMGCLSAPAQADDRKILFIGDSMTSLYNDTPGSSSQGWWSMVARSKGLTPVTDAEYGSGFLRKGFGTTNNSGTACTGTVLKNRLAKIAELDSQDIVIVAAGRNDLKKCVNGKAVAATTTESVNAAKAYFAALRTATLDAGISKARVYVMVPWAYSQTTESTVLRPKIRDAAKAQGFTWILTWALSDAETNSDGLHQNLAGNKSLRDDVLAGVNF